jgi:FAD/FMN-containing dehydrogenase
MLTVEQLGTSFSGKLVRPSDPEYDMRRATFNATIDRRPEAIVICRCTDDVLRSVELAEKENLPIAVRGGGHSVAGHSVCDGGLVIDLSGMRAVAVDPYRRVAVAEGGATWEDFDRATQMHELATTGGTDPDTGIAGLTLGGGIGFLTGKHGLTVDTLRGAELVTADARVVWASEKENEDLFWALRGGGGNFGVVTRFEYRLHPVTDVYGGMITYPLTSATEVLARLGELLPEAPDELTCQLTFGCDEEMGRVLKFAACYLGRPADGASLLASLRRISMIADTIESRSYLQMQAIYGKVPFGLRHYWKGHFVRSLPHEVVKLSVETYENRPVGLSELLIEPITGAPTRVSNPVMAYNQRDARFNVSAMAVWTDPAHDAEQTAWVREYAAALEPFSTTGAGYLNYMAADEPIERVRAVYGADKFERLRQIKRRYDGRNVFRFNHNIPPSD